MSTVSPTPAGPSPDAHDGRTRIIRVDHSQVAPSDIAVGVIIGRTSEHFDFFVFGIASVLIFPSVFFPFVPLLQGMIYSFTLFSLGFVARPFGSLLFRLIHDHYGRGAKLTAALFALGTTTAGIAFLPSYDSLGMTAVVMLALLRIGQGLAVGGSWDGLPSLLALSAPKERRGWYAMMSQISAPIGFMIAAALYAYLDMNLSVADFMDWGWRYPFYVAFAINVVALFARLRLVVTPEYVRLLKTRELEPSPVGDLLRTQRRNIYTGAFASLASYALFHLVTVFALGWAVLYTHQSAGHFLMVQILGAVIAIPCMILSGVVADRIGRRNTLGIAAVLIAVYSGWTAVLLSGSTTGGYLFILLGFALLGFSYAQAAGAINSRFPSAFRYSGAVVTSDMGWLIGAAFAPLVALELATHFGIGYVGLYLLSGGIGTLAALRVDRNFEMRDE
ncbi:MAG: MFS transporter [Stenotrophobium sp.]